VIIVPDLAREAGRPRTVATTLDPVRLPDGRLHLAIRCNGRPDTARVWHEREQERHERAEEQRVFYVALTRARERLILLAGPARTATPWLDTLQAWGYDPARPPAAGARLAAGEVEHRLLAPGAVPAPVAGPAEPFPAAAVAAYNAATDLARAASRPRLHSPTGASEDPEAAGGAATPRSSAAGGTPASAEARGIGILVHRLLQEWQGADSKALAARIADLAPGVAAETAAAPARLATGSMEVMAAFLQSPLAARLSALAPLARELPVLLQGGDGSGWRGSIDLLYRDAGGALAVADFKTDRESDAALLAARHAPQLAVYAEAVRRAFRLTALPRSELWMLRHGSVVVLDVAPEISRLKLAPLGG
jgi:ATP-dependent exoDNAse (exonuclease V) beta subunit